MQTVDFDLSVFSPYLGHIVELLMRLIDDAETIETKRRVIQVLCVIVEVSGPLESADDYHSSTIDTVLRLSLTWVSWSNHCLHIVSVLSAFL